VTACPRSRPIRSSRTAVSLRGALKGTLTCARTATANTRQAERRQTCTTNPHNFVSARPSVARSATEDLASSGTIPGEPRSVQRSALIGSGRVRKPTANGYPGFARPDKACIVYSSYWEAPREIHSGQWQDALRSACLCDVRETDFSRLPPGNRDAPHLLQSRLLRRSLQQRNPAS